MYTYTYLYIYEGKSLSASLRLPNFQPPQRLGLDADLRTHHRGPYALVEDPNEVSKALLADAMIHGQGLEDLLRLPIRKLQAREVCERSEMKGRLALRTQYIYIYVIYIYQRR